MPHGPAACVRPLRPITSDYPLLHGAGGGQELVRKPTSTCIIERGPQAKGAGQGEEEVQVVTSHSGSRAGEDPYTK